MAVKSLSYVVITTLRTLPAFYYNSHRLARFSPCASHSSGHCTACWAESAHTGTASRTSYILRSNSAFFAANSSSDKMLLCLSSAKRSMVAKYPSPVPQRRQAPVGVEAGLVEAEDPSFGLPRRALAMIGKVLTSTTPCWLVKLTVLPVPCC